MKFSLGKKSRDSSSSSPAPSSSNPYAQPPPAQPQTQEKNPYSNNVSDPRAPPDMRAKAAYNPYDAPGSAGPAAGGYGAPSNSGYSSSRYGNGGGYGSSRYENPTAGAGTSRYGPGGYGGMGNLDSPQPPKSDYPPSYRSRDTRSDYRPAAAASSSSSPVVSPTNSYSNVGTPSESGAYGEGSSHDQVLDDEDEVVAGYKAEAKAIRREDVALTNNSVQLIEQMQQTGLATLATLEQQGESLHNTKRNIHTTLNQNAVAKAKTKELRRENKGMFHAALKNPMRTSAGRRAADAEAVAQQQRIRQQSEMLRGESSKAKSDVNTIMHQVERRRAQPKPRLANRSDMLLFEADSEDEQDEATILNNLDDVKDGLDVLLVIAKGTQTMVDDHISTADSIGELTEKADDQLAGLHSQIRRIR